MFCHSISSGRETGSPSNYFDVIQCRIDSPADTPRLLPAGFRVPPPAPGRCVGLRREGGGILPGLLVLPADSGSWRSLSLRIRCAYFRCWAAMRERSAFSWGTLAHRPCPQPRHAGSGERCLAGSSRSVSPPSCSAGGADAGPREPPRLLSPGRAQTTAEQWVLAMGSARLPPSLGIAPAHRVFLQQASFLLIP